MKPLKELWSLGIIWIKIKIQSPFSNGVTKVLLYTGAAIVATPLLEHLLFSAVLKKWLGIDLGVEVPDTEAYITGSILMVLGVTHNLIYLALRNERDVKIIEAKNSVYRELWDYCDKAIDDVVRLSHLYTSKPSPDDEKYVSQAENSVIKYMGYLRQHRPFLFSEEFYQKGCELNKISWWQIQCFRACMQMKEKHLKDGNQDYDFYLAEKTTNKDMDHLIEKYNGFCEEIRKYVEAI
ncbi:hypothetical protein GCM10022421_10050 [Oceanisphaera sediminis]|uniref:SMODS and SLOG-associating 2TM effector domain-containing protein n=1 Tax=Oceanisphaera sediminis TaxID=981381 RepID=A0ABP7DJM6_9GAMM